MYAVQLSMLCDGILAGDSCHRHTVHEGPDGMHTWGYHCSGIPRALCDHGKEQQAHESTDCRLVAMPLFCFTYETHLLIMHDCRDCWGMALGKPLS